MTPLTFWGRVEDLATSITNKLAKPFRAKATSVNTSGVQIQTYGSDAPLGERFSRLRGTTIANGDEVAVIPYGGSFLVLGAIDKSGVSARSMTDGTDGPSVTLSDTNQTQSATSEGDVSRQLDALDLEDPEDLKNAVALLRSAIGV